VAKLLTHPTRKESKMDTETMVPTEAPDEIARLNGLVIEANKKYMALNTKYWVLRDRITTTEDLIKDALAEGNIEEDFAKELAEALGIELARTVKVTVNLTATVEIELGINEDPDDIGGNHFSFGEPHYSGKGSMENYEEDDITVEVQE
jgi:hypothetical protein